MGEVNKKNLYFLAHSYRHYIVIGTQFWKSSQSNLIRTSCLRAMRHHRKQIVVVGMFNMHTGAGAALTNKKWNDKWNPWKNSQLNTTLDHAAAMHKFYQSTRRQKLNVKFAIHSQTQFHSMEKLKIIHLAKWRRKKRTKSAPAKATCTLETCSSSERARKRVRVCNELNNETNERKTREEKWGYKMPWARLSLSLSEIVLLLRTYSSLNWLLRSIFLRAYSLSVFYLSKKSLLQWLKCIVLYNMHKNEIES